MLALKHVFDVSAPDVSNPHLASEFAQTRGLGLTSFPSLLMEINGRFKGVDLSYDPQIVVTRIKASVVNG
jgi:hypothetical protein